MVYNEVMLIVFSVCANNLRKCLLASHVLALPTGGLNFFSILIQERGEVKERNIDVEEKH